jgi:hypothetical protein
LEPTLRDFSLFECGEQGDKLGWEGLGYIRCIHDAQFAADPVLGMPADCGPGHRLLVPGHESAPLHFVIEQVA